MERRDELLRTYPEYAERHNTLLALQQQRSDIQQAIDRIDEERRQLGDRKAWAPELDRLRRELEQYRRNQQKSQDAADRELGLAMQASKAAGGREVKYVSDRGMDRFVPISQEFYAEAERKAQPFREHSEQWQAKAEEVEARIAEIEAMLVDDPPAPPAVDPSVADLLGIDTHHEPTRIEQLVAERETLVAKLPTLSKALRFAEQHLNETLPDAIAAAGVQLDRERPVLVKAMAAAREDLADMEERAAEMLAPYREKMTEAMAALKRLENERRMLLES